VTEWRFLQELEARIHELEEYTRAVESQLARRPTAVHEQGESRHGGAGQAAAAAVVLCIALLSPAVAGASERGQLWVDRSSSVGSLESALDRALQVTHRSGIGDWDVFAFAGDAYSAAAVYTIRFPVPATPECRNQARRGELSGMFSSIAEAEKKKQEAECGRFRAEARARYETEVDSAIRNAHERVLKHFPAEPGRTCLLDLMMRIAEGSPVPAAVLIVTDGEETCRPGNRRVIGAPRGQMAVVMTVAPMQKLRAGQTQHERFTQTKDQWKRWVPWVQVVAPYSLTPELLRESRAPLEPANHSMAVASR
jgi:hypothetical protein